MTEFFDLISKINEQHHLVVDIKYSWRTNCTITVREDGRDIPLFVIHDMKLDFAFYLATKELLDRYF